MGLVAWDIYRIAFIQALLFSIRDDRKFTLENDQHLRTGMVVPG